MRVLLTGAFGNVGVSALEALLAGGHEVRCFDLPTRPNRRAARRYGGRIEAAWGDLRHAGDLEDAVRDRDVVVHLAFIIPKLSVTGVGSEDRPDWAREINVGGTRRLVEACLAQPLPPRLIFSSSLHVYGFTCDQPPPRTVDDPVRPTEHYSQHKIECEELIRNSGLAWAIMRFGAVLPLAIKLDPGMFDVPLGNRMEFVHTRDVGLAIVRAVESEQVWGKVWLIGGGPRCQLYFREIAEAILTATGVGMLPEQAFSRMPFATDWLDTTESEAVLHYQRLDIHDYAREMARLLGWRGLFLRAFRPLVRRVLLRASPYYERRRSGWEGRVALVTGATGGIGGAIARRLAREGLRVVLVGRRAATLEALSEEICRQGGEAVALPADLAEAGACRRVVDQAFGAYRGVDVLVNAAGLGWYGYGNEMPRDLAREMLQVNAGAVMELTLLCLERMKERGGHIVNVSSVAGSLPEQGIALYSATKAFVDSFTTALYRELRGTRLHVSLVRPGAVNTAFFASAASQPAGRAIPGQRLAVSAEAVADRVWAVLRRPRRVVHVPRVLGLVAWVEPGFGWLIDRLGPVLLRRAVHTM